MNDTSVVTPAVLGSGRYDTDAIRRANPLDRVARDYGLALKRRGAGRFTAFCPFHDDRRTPNLHIDARDPATAHFHCFAGHCRAHGDVIRFVMRLERLDFRRACAQLGGTPGPAVPGDHRAIRSTGQEQRCPSPRHWDRLTLEEQTVMNIAGAIYRRALWRHAAALRYLYDRGLPRWLIRRCGLGWADGHTLATALREHADPRLLPLALDLDLLRRRPGCGLTDALAGRIVVPEIRGGHCIWFIGRGLGPGGGTSFSAVKYLALPGERPTLGQEWVSGASEAFACEGVFDWLAALAWGLPAWCPCGTHFPTGSLGFLARARQVYGVFDGDDAGRAASLRFAEGLGRRYHALPLPEGSDLSDLLLRAEGRACFRALVADARRAEPGALRVDRLA